MRFHNLSIARCTGWVAFPLKNTPRDYQKEISHTCSLPLLLLPLCFVPSSYASRSVSLPQAQPLEADVIQRCVREMLGDISSQESNAVQNSLSQMMDADEASQVELNFPQISSQLLN